VSNDFNLDAELRTDLGKGASRRLRRENKVPAILYGGEGEPVSVTLPANVVARVLQEESFYSSIIMLTVDGKTERTILRDLQRHPYMQTILHMDFQRLVAGQ
jgi:large subunit ribosomal protein L25